MNVVDAAEANPKVKRAPSFKKLAYSYTPSHDGTDENLLILLHGFGDTHVPFTKLGRSLKLPQTATLAVRAPDLIPFLMDDDPEGFQWYQTYDNLGEELTSPNPSQILNLLSELLNHLIQNCSWSPIQLHLFGFAQGGTVAAELALAFARGNQGHETQLGSVTTVCGPLLSLPTISNSATPILILHRPESSASALSQTQIKAFSKGFNGRVLTEELTKEIEGMPASAKEWTPVMRFWGDTLSRRIAGQDVYRVIKSPN